MVCSLPPLPLGMGGNGRARLRGAGGALALALLFLRPCVGDAAWDDGEEGTATARASIADYFSARLTRDTKV